jgi:hypothetical protein
MLYSCTDREGSYRSTSERHVHLCCGVWRVERGKTGGIAYHLETPSLYLHLAVP